MFSKHARMPYLSVPRRKELSRARSQRRSALEAFYLPAVPILLLRASGVWMAGLLYVALIVASAFIVSTVLSLPCAVMCLCTG